MKVIERYILKEAFGYFLISLVAFTSVLLSVRILRFANLIINKGVELSQIISVFIAVIPTFMEFAVPMAALLGCVLAIARLSGDSEIVVLRASGISILQLVRPVLIYGLLATIIALSLSYYLRPWGYRKLDQLLFEIAQTKTTSGLEAGIFNQLGKIVLYADIVDYSNGDLKNVLVDDRRQDNERKIIVAQSGIISSNPDIYEIIIVLKNGSIHEKIGEQYTLTNFDSNFLRIDANELMGRGKRSSSQKVNQYSTTDLIQEIRDRTHGNTAIITDLPKNETGSAATEKRIRPLSELKFELARRFSLPFASLLLALLGLPLGIQPPRLQKTWGATFSLSIGLLIFALYFGLLTFASAMAENEKLNASIAAWLPNIIILLLALYFLQRVGTEKWHSVAHLFDKIQNTFTKILRIKPKTVTT